MNSKSDYKRRLTRIVTVSSLLTVGLCNFQFSKAQAQVLRESNIIPEAKDYPVMWDTIFSTGNYNQFKADWEVIPEYEEQNQPSSSVIWEELNPFDSMEVLPSEKESNTRFIPPGSLEEAEALLETIPLQASDFTPLLNLSHAVPTASVLGQDEWRLISSTISPFKYASGTGNQNYAIQLDYGLSDTLQISGFYSEADDPLNTKIAGLDIRPGNFWGVFGAAARWKFLTNKNWSMAFNSSLESWTVGSGGSDSVAQNSGDNTSPNIFNDSGKRVETQNIVGSIALPLTWQANKKWQFTFAPGISFLPSSQGKGQGGAGEFYGNNFYISGGLLWHPIPEIGFTASIAKPLGTGANSFDSNLRYSNVPVYSGGLSWHLNPRIALQGQLTNGFGATPATGILTLPSDNRLGYNAKIVITPDAPDTPQPPLSIRQQSLSLGGLTVNTAVVPPDKTSVVTIGSDTGGTFDTTFGFSISNIFQLKFYRSASSNIPQSNVQARTYLTDGGVNWRGSGKAVLTSPLRGAPAWSALRMSFGRNVDTIKQSSQGYLFTETPITWEATSKIAFNINPKAAWSGTGNLWGMGISAYIDLAPRWQLIPETNIVFNDPRGSNGTLCLRWNATDDIAIEAYGSTASAIVDIGQLINAEEVRWGGRFIIKL